MTRRIFIAINLDDKTKKFISNKIAKWNDQLPLRWVLRENYHLTLAFIGLIEDENTEKIIVELNRLLSDVEAFDFTLDEISWGPKKDNPKMLWLRGGQNQSLVELRNIVENAVAGFPMDKKTFRPHINLGKIVRSKSQLNLPIIEEKTNILVPVTSVDVMESVSEEGKRKYYVMESIELR